MLRKNASVLRNEHPIGKSAGVNFLDMNQAHRSHMYRDSGDEYDGEDEDDDVDHSRRDFLTGGR